MKIIIALCASLMLFCAAPMQYDVCISKTEITSNRPFAGVIVTGQEEMVVGTELSSKLWLSSESLPETATYRIKTCNLGYLLGSCSWELLP